MSKSPGIDHLFSYETPERQGRALPCRNLGQAPKLPDLEDPQDLLEEDREEEAAPTEVVEGEATAPELIMEADEPPDPAEPGARSQIVATWQAQQLAEMAQLDL